MLPYRQIMTQSVTPVFIQPYAKLPERMLVENNLFVRIFMHLTRFYFTTGAFLTSSGSHVNERNTNDNAHTIIKTKFRINIEQGDASRTHFAICTKEIRRILSYVHRGGLILTLNIRHVRWVQHTHEFSKSIKIQIRLSETPHGEGFLLGYRAGTRHFQRQSAEP